MANRVVVDPLTRIEGHLRIEAQLEGGAIREAYSAGTLVRGIEIILKGRDPRDAWAFTQRICGVCTLVHGIASVRAVENAVGAVLPPNAELIRNLMIAAQFIHDHVMHFYHLHALDWVDVISALKADPQATADLSRSVNSAADSSPGYFASARQKLEGLAQSGKLGIFANGYWGHPGYKLPPEANLMAVAHYLEALGWQRQAAKLHAIFGGRNPHPNFVVAGVPSPIDLDSDTALNAARLAEVQNLIGLMRDFVDRFYVPDVLAIAGFYPEWAGVGEGTGNFLSYGDLPAADGSGQKLFPAGVILGRDLGTVHPIDAGAADQIQEYIAHSWYEYTAGRDRGLHPYQGETNLRYHGPRPPIEQLDVSKGYSWLKSPRWRGKPMEVGPLARVLMLVASGDQQATELVDGTLARLKLPRTALFSTLGRTAARALETKLLADAMPSWFDRLVANIRQGETRTFDEKKWDPSTWPRQARGVGLMEAPRGALAHYVVIEDGKIANYQAVVPSTWNAGPRDAAGQPGPYEAALAGQAMVDSARPLEILRTIHSFDPCIACAVHVVDAEGKEVGTARVI